MATYPYTSGLSALVKAFDQFRKAFPPSVDAPTLKRLGIAPGNESYIINIFRFVGLIDESGKKIDGNADIFFHGEESFKSGLEGLVHTAYADLFADHGESAWSETKEALSTWFRVRDKTSELIGGRQASTFMTLASICGRGDGVRGLNIGRSNGSATPAKSPTVKASAVRASHETAASPDGGRLPNANGSSVQEVGRSGVGLTVRVEVNLPGEASPETYDAIFASIRKNLIDP